ncbi:response regulator [Luteimonas deserti]|uniref:Response regulator n=1 Tax=Luteimonas deserti TaxID=2752306 RepID=A0A7Z0QTC8_9GAMM|nr:response regulator [Luteimonas deserti]NYZ63108.1 response regulator [Luteimonas deserti]
MTRLLLVEDDPTSRNFLLAAAAALPADVEVAATVAQAYTRAARGGHDAWLIDAQLPDGTGVGLLAQLRRDGLEVPALAHTAARESDALDALRAAGFVLAVSKPLSAGAWQAAIRRLLGPTRAADRPSQPSSESPSGAAVWNAAAALAAVGGDAANAQALRALFLGELPGTRDTIVRASETQDLPAVRAALHRLRAGCGFVGADRLGTAAAALHATPDSRDALRAFRDAVQRTLEGG